MDIFGSAATSEFGPKSDVDVLIEFDEAKDDNLFDMYFKLKSELQTIFNRPVDIIIEHSVKNPILKENMNKTRINIYAV